MLLNRRLFSCFLHVLSTTLKGALNIYYEDFALVRNSEAFMIFQATVVSLNGLEFNISCDSEYCPVPTPIRGIRKQITASWSEVAKNLLFDKRKRDESEPAVKLQVRAMKMERELATSRATLEHEIVLFGCRLEDICKSRKLCISAYQSPDLALPDVVIRCIAVTWSGIHSNHSFTYDTRRSANDKFSLLHLELERMGGEGLSIFNHVDVDIDFRYACLSISENSRYAAEGNLGDIGFLLKFLIHFLEELSEPLIPTEFAEPLLCCTMMVNEQDVIQNLSSMIQAFPTVHARLLDLLLRLVNVIPGTAKVAVINDLALALRIKPSCLNRLLSLQIPVFATFRNQMKDLAEHLVNKNTRIRVACDGLNRQISFIDCEHTQDVEIILRVIWGILGTKWIETGGYISEVPVEGPKRMTLESSGWLYRGSTTENITLEFRAGGETSLRNVAYFCGKHRRKARQIVASDRYPFMQIGSQIGKISADVLEVSLSGLKLSKEMASNPWWDMLDDEDALDRVYCMTFLLFDIHFVNLESISKVLQETKSQMLDLLKLGPRNVNALWHSWIQLRAEMSHQFKQRPYNRFEQRPYNRPTLPPPIPKPARVDPIASQVIPKLLGESRIMNEQHIINLEVSLPAQYHGYDWKLVFSNLDNGYDLTKLYQQAGEHDSLILLIKDSNGFIFGGFTATPWKVSPGYVGTGENFLFSLEPEFKVYGWTEVNMYFMLVNEDSFALGGGGEFGIYLDADLQTGTSGVSGTFGNPCLASTPEFTCSSIELWAFERRN